MFQLVHTLKLPRWLADTAATGLSNAYDAFCVASQRYKELFTEKGIIRKKIIVTGIPNFDNFASINKDAFPYTNYVLVATSPNWPYVLHNNRQNFITHCKKIAESKQLIFKLHPLENTQKAEKEIKQIVPDALVFWRGNVDEMIAGASAVITQQSS